MLQFYIGFISPVLEYAVAAWHTGLITELSDQLEITQKRALRIAGRVLIIIIIISYQILYLRNRHFGIVLVLNQIVLW